MKKGKNILTYILVAVLILGIGVGIGTIIPKGHKQSSSDKEETADNGLVRTVDGTTPEMLTAEYWLNEDSDQVLFTAEEIAEFNENNPPYVIYSSEMDDREYHLYMYDLPETISHEAVLDLMPAYTVPNYSNASRPFYINGELPDEAYWISLEKNYASGQIPDNVTPEYYICLERVVARKVPSDDFASQDPEERFFNDFVAADIAPFTGVVGLHESADGQWVYVLSGSFCGWVKTESLAKCKNREAWLAACRPEQFLVVLGSELVMDETAVPTASSGMLLPMGTKIKLSDQDSDMVNGRSTYGAYVVEMPYRDADGMLDWEMALVPISKDVHVGYPVMTSGSVVTQSFKLLGKVYGYGGSLSSNDCSGIVRQIYACYGLELPRNARAIAKLADLGSFDSTNMTAAKKRAVMEKMPAGMPLYMDGHLMVYLGSVDGDPYVISSCATFIEPDHELTDIRQANCVFVSNLELLRSNGKTWLEDICYILWKEY